MKNETIVPLDTLPAVDGLVFRHFRGEEDYPKLYGAFIASEDFDETEDAETLDDFVHNYKYLVRCDITKDLVAAEVDGDIVGYARVYWDHESEEGRMKYTHFGFVKPDWRNRGIGFALMQWGEGRLRQIAATHVDNDLPKVFGAFSMRAQATRFANLEKLGYQPEHYFVSMIRPNAAVVPDIPLPDGLEFRPYRDEDLMKIHAANVEAFRDHVGFVEPTAEDIERWRTGRFFQPHLWCVVWDGDEVVGSIQNFIEDEENKKFNRKRGYTENISVRRQWRKMGVAKAMLAWSIRKLHEQGMEETALGVHTENPNGAFHLYQGMGYEKDKEFIDLVKPF